MYAFRTLILTQTSLWIEFFCKINSAVKLTKIARYKSRPPFRTKTQRGQRAGNDFGKILRTFSRGLEPGQLHSNQSQQTKIEIATRIRYPLLVNLINKSIENKQLFNKLTVNNYIGYVID